MNKVQKEYVKHTTQLLILRREYSGCLQTSRILCIYHLYNGAALFLHWNRCLWEFHVSHKVYLPFSTASKLFLHKISRKS